MTNREEVRTLRVPIVQRLNEDVAGSGNDQLVSRSQAKRLLNYAETFSTVVLDFNGIDSIGQAFADEAFRVFPAHHPHTEIVSINTSPEVEKMIRRVKAHRG